MRILLLVHAFNGLAQRLHVELRADGHDISVELDIHESVSIEAVALFQPDVVLAPFLKRAIPAQIWQSHMCFIVHPGPRGDRGPAALDWAILRALPSWGVTVLQAQAEMDAGPVWATMDFAMRDARKSSLYRHEVTDGAVRAVRAALWRLASGLGPLPPAQLPSAAAGAPHGWQPALSPSQRAIDWCRDDSATVLRKIDAADSYPGVEHELLGSRFRMFDARTGVAPTLAGTPPIPGSVLGIGGGAGGPDDLCLATRDGAIWIGQLLPMDDAHAAFKQPAVQALGRRADGLARLAAPASDIRYEESGAVGWLYFDFYNGALGTSQCARLRAAYALARKRPTRVIVLMGGKDFWCNGMHLHAIEASPSAGSASWENILQIDDLALDILTTDTHLTMAALGNNAAAGGVFLALATDTVVARAGVVLNPHYRNMGNLHGSEYWTYLLPRRVGPQRADRIVAGRMPMGAPEAQALGLIDEVAGPDRDDFGAHLGRRARALAQDPQFTQSLDDKKLRRARDEQQRTLSDFRRAELEQMRLNFFGFDPSYHVARHRFVHRTPAAWTPLHLARHRQLAFAPTAALRNAPGVLHGADCH